MADPNNETKVFGLSADDRRAVEKEDWFGWLHQIGALGSNKETAQ